MTLTPQEKKEISEKWTEKNNKMLWTTVTESKEVLDFWLALLDTKLKQQLENIESEIEELRPESCSCSNGKNECEHWGIHETVDSAKAIISKYKEITN